MQGRADRRRALTIVGMAAALAYGLAADPVQAQRRDRPAPFPIIPTPQFLQKTFPPPLPALPEVMPPESIQADVSTRSVAITSSFTGTEIVAFGAVDNSRQTSAEAGLYDVVVVLEGVPNRLVARRKSKVAGIWINTTYVVYENVPSYYAIASTRPVEELADEATLRENQVGFEHIQLTPAETSHPMAAADLKAFRESVIRLKVKDGLFVQEDYGAAFIGRSLFRASIDLPANVPVGPLVARVYLFREGQMLSRFIARVNLEREGVERLLHSFSQRHAVWYGLATVLLAAASGLIASRLFRRGAH